MSQPDPLENYWDDEDAVNRDARDVEVPEPREEDERGCCFPGKCVMPGEHFRHECHTAEMVEDFEREQRNAAGRSRRED